MLSDPEPPTKEHTQVRPRPPCTYVTDVQLGLHVGPLTAGVEASFKICCLYVGHVLLFELLCLDSVREDMPCLENT